MAQWMGQGRRSICFVEAFLIVFDVSAGEALARRFGVFYIIVFRLRVVWEYRPSKKSVCTADHSERVLSRRTTTMGSL
jgi:hypothetical protein